MPTDPRVAAARAASDPDARLSQRLGDAERAAGRNPAAVSWQAVSFAPNWSEFAGATYPVSYCRLANGVVVMRGLVMKSGSAPGTFERLLTLPVGFRPAHEVQIPTIAMEVFAGLVLQADGDLLTRGVVPGAWGAGGWCSVDPVTFRAEQ